MRVAIVLGFYDSVLVSLQRMHSALLSDQTIVWVGPLGPHGDGDIVNFQGVLFDRLTVGFTEVLVLAVVRRGEEGSYRDRIDRIIFSATQRYPLSRIDLMTFAFAAAADAVDKAIRAFLDVCEQAEVYPSTLEGLETWCGASVVTSSGVETPMSDRLLILPRAIDEARNSAFEDVPLVYKSLKVLANEYWELRVKGGLERKRKWHSALEDLGLAVAPSMSKSRAGEQRAEYYVNYPIGSPPGNTRFLEQHLKKGNDRDQRFCFRLYFFWDKKKNLVVVGWLPSHLDTRST